MMLMIDKRLECDRMNIKFRLMGKGGGKEGEMRGKEGRERGG